MKTANKIQRRKFIQLAAMSAGAALAVGYLPGIGDRSRIVNLTKTGAQGLGLNQYIFIDFSGKITLFNHRPEMGQGTYQAIPMIIAEELEVDINKVEIMQSPADRPKYGDQMVVGSRSIQGQFAAMRKIGAAAKEMLIKAAANKWKAPEQECYAKDANVIHRPSGNKFSYGELVEDASKLSAPQNPILKDPKDFTIIGRSFPRRDIPEKTNGAAKFGIDFSVPGMLYASIERSPVFLGKIVSYNDAKAKAIPGVKHVFKTKRDVMGFTREGVAVLADTYWAAVQGRKVLEIKWDNGDLESWSTQKIKDNYKKAAEQEGVIFQEKGNFKEAFANGKIKIEASYETPYQSHAPMEPMNAMVHVQKDKCEFWGSTQNPNGIRSQLAKQTGIAEDKVIVNYTYMGGGFGRRSMTDVSEEATDLSMQSGAPVKVIWTREDDTTQGPFRACSLNVCKGVVDESGNAIALEHKIICQDIRNQSGTGDKPTGGIAGGINTVYEIPNFSISGVLQKFYIPVTFWRSVYHSTNCFAHESFIDELAHAAKKDPIDFRLAILKNHRRYTQVLKIVAEKTHWYQPRKKDTGKGVSIVERSGAFTALVIDVAKVNAKVKIEKITAVIDCGTYVNPDTVKAQCEGSIVMGLTATYKSGLTIAKGKVVEKNFDNYKMLQINECPEIDVTVIKSTDPPEGAGESGLANVAPALTNAIFNMTGKRIRTLPFKLEEI
ncbi:MAG TPA: molybdopterin cofactor-binding domain-containing protein [Chitinophagaceae bacterium]|nr:molybdopterin cofactor-binding domain-containing protein [Chitinophagaceae bacterium]